MHKDRKYWRAYIKARVKPDTATGCWNWQLSLTYGYGQAAQAHAHGLSCRAHRVAYTVFKGPIPAGLLVRHTCHNRRCCNPAHLRTGTSQDNTDDNRLHGLSHGRETLTTAQVLSIKRLLAAGVHLQKDIAARFGVRPPAISNISTGRRWAHVK